MNELEKVDYTLLVLYEQTRNGGMINIIPTLNSNNQILTFAELKKIVDLLQRSKNFAVFQIAHGPDYRGKISPLGIEFVESDSFSNPGISILKLKN